MIPRNLAEGLSIVKHTLAICKRGTLLEGDTGADSGGDGTRSSGENESKRNEGCLRVHFLNGIMTI